MPPAGFHVEIHHSLLKGVPLIGALVSFAHVLFLGADLGFSGIDLAAFIRHRAVVTGSALALTFLAVSRWGKGPLTIRLLGHAIIALCGVSVSILTAMTGGSVSPYWTMLMLTFFGATLMLRFSVIEAACLYAGITAFHLVNMLLLAGDSFYSPGFFTTACGMILASVVSLTGNWYIRALQLREYQARQSLAEANEQLKQSVTELQYKRQQAELRHLQTKLDLANDLHDTVGAQLSQIAVLAENERLESTQHLKALASSVLENVRNFAHILKGEEKVAGLHQQLHRMAQSLRSLGRYTVELTLPPDEPRLSDVALLNIDRIFSECTANAIRHAHASGFALGARTRQSRLLVWFYQNATPFTWRGSADRGGLKSIAVRAKSIGAKVSVRARRGGSVFLLSIDNLKS